MDWLTAHIQPGEDVQLRSLTNDQTILVLAGPKAQAVMAAVSRGDWSDTAFPWLSVRECCIGFVPATVLGVSFSGERAYEIHVPNAHLYAAYKALRAAGATHGMRLFGAHAVESMRHEKGYLHWKAELLTEFDPFETGLDRFVKLDKGDFVGRDALLKRQTLGPQRKLVSLVVEDDYAPAYGGASLMDGDAVVGTITSGAYGHRVGLNIARAFVLPEKAAEGTEMMLDSLGRAVPVRVVSPVLYDPAGDRLRAT